MKGFNLSAWALTHRSFVLFLMAVAVGAGAIAFGRLGRGEDPAFTFRTMVVSASWPGATLEETLNQVTERLERTLQEVPNIDFLRSQTTAGRVIIFVTLLGSTSPRDVPDAWYQTRKKIGDIRHTLPPGVVGPFFNDEFGDTVGIIYGFTADGFTHRELRDYVEGVRSRLLRVPDVSKIELIGTQDERIYIEFSSDTLSGLGLDRAALIAALQAQNLVRPAGAVETGQETLSVRVTGAFGSEQDIRDVTFAVGGRMIRLADIAEVRRATADPPQPMFRVNGEPAIGLAVAMRDGGDVLALGRNIHAAVAELTADLPVGIEARLVSDQPTIVDEAIGDFTASLWQAIVIILACSLLALGLRAGAVVALSIPLVLAIVFAVMLVAGIDLHRISLGALIIALALMVDDAMTMTDAMLRRRAAGDSLQEGAAYAYRTLALPMLTGTLVTIAGFLPIGFARSAAGEYTFSIFAVVGIALIVSWLVAVVFAPLLGLAVLPRQVKAAAPGQGGEGAVMRVYRRLLDAALRARWVTILVALGLFVAAVFALRLVPQQFFPSSDRLELTVELRLPQSASIQAMEAAAMRLDEILAADPDVERFSTYVGRGAVRFYLPLNVQLPNAFLAESVVIARDLPARKRLEERLHRTLQEEFPAAVGRVAPLELGPPVGWPVQYRIIGPDLDVVRGLALRLASVVAADPGVRDVNFDWMEPARQLRIHVDQEQARLLGLSSGAIASALASTATGASVTQLRDDIYLVDVVARATEAERVSIDSLRNLQVPIPGGRSVALSAFATFGYGQEQPLVWRRDRMPALTVQADVVPGTLPDVVMARLGPAVAALAAELPRGYRVEAGGIVEEGAKSRASVFAVVPVMLLVTLTLLMAQLQSFQRVAIVLSVVPLGLIGAVGALLAFGRPLGFVAILGILSLLGMVAKNAVILLGQIEIERAAGLPVREAVAEAAVSRFRPIVLTAVSTVLGMIPIAFTVFWGPMALAIMGGLLAATLLTLVFLPAVYFAWFGRAQAVQRPVGAEERATTGVP